MASPKDLATKSGSSEAIVSAVIASVVDMDTIRSNGAASVPLLVIELEKCARQYTGCVKTEDLVFDECVEFVMLRFGFLNINEIREAFRLAAAGELGEVKLEAYFGTFTVAMLGKVLAAYRNYRERISKEVRAAEIKHQYAQTFELASQNHDSEAWIRTRREKLTTNLDLTAHDVTVYDFACFEKEILAALTEDEKRPAWEKAWQMTVADYQDMVLRGNLSACRVLENPIKHEGFNHNRKDWYKRLLVVTWAQKERQ